MNELPFSDFSGFLNWAGSPLGLAAMGAAISVFVKDMDWFENLKSKQKSTMMFITTVFLLPLIFIYIPPRLPDAIISEGEAFFNVFMVGAVAYLMSQVTHETLNQKILKRKNGVNIRVGTQEPFPPPITTPQPSHLTPEEIAKMDGETDDWLRETKET